MEADHEEEDDVVEGPTTGAETEGPEPREANTTTAAKANTIPTTSRLLEGPLGGAPDAAAGMQNTKLVMVYVVDVVTL